MGGAGESFASCCAVFSSLAIVHLLLFAQLMNSRAVSFAIAGVEMNWNLEEKAKACYMASLFYAFTLFFSVLARIYIKRQSVEEAVIID